MENVIELEVIGRKAITIPISVTALDEAGALITDIVSGQFAMTQGVTKVTKVCTVIGSVVSVKLTPAETALMEGLYMMEMRIKSSTGDIDPLMLGTILIETTPITEVF